MTTPLKIMLVEDNNSFRYGLKKIVTLKLGHKVIAEAENGETALDLINKTEKPDLILMDIYMGELTGIETTKNIIWEYPKSKVLAITNHFDRMFLRTLIEAGFKGCISKRRCVEELQIAIEAIQNNELYFPNSLNIQ